MKKYIEDVRDQLVCLMVDMEYDDSDIREVFSITQEQIEKAEQKQKHIFYPLWVRNVFYKENKKRTNGFRKQDTVYFIKQDTKGGMIKIGYTSKDVSQRLSDIQTNSPHKLIILKTIEGDLKTEAKLHKKFTKYRLSGEWFSPSFELVSYIDSL